MKSYMYSNHPGHELLLSFIEQWIHQKAEIPTYVKSSDLHKSLQKSQAYVCRHLRACIKFTYNKTIILTCVLVI